LQKSPPAFLNGMHQPFAGFDADALHIGRTVHFADKISAFWRFILPAGQSHMFEQKLRLEIQ